MKKSKPKYKVEDIVNELGYGKFHLYKIKEIQHTRYRYYCYTDKHIESSPIDYIDRYCELILIPKLKRILLGLE
jgi:hypothetical protein